MKRIITCNDGTWNKPDTVDDGAGVMTNVEKIYKCITPTGHDNTPQVKFYDEGVGTGPGFWNKLVGGVTGAGIDKNIKDTYKFIMWNYEPGDELYLFGFSRGAYTARSLAGLIRNCGILRPEYLHLVDEAYELYRDRTILAHPDSDTMLSFRRLYSYNGKENTKIKCIGVWDTVGALGIPLHFFQLSNKERYKFHDVNLSSWVQNAFHALAIDERRKTFSPTLWETSPNMPKENKMEQVWFSGVHANIGGGYKQNGLSDISLEWMIEKTSRIGLYFNKLLLKDDSTLHRNIHIRPMLKGFMRDSIKDFWIYWFEKAAWRIMFYKRDAENPAKICLDRAGHKMQAQDTNEMLHATAYDRFKSRMDNRTSPFLEETLKIFFEKDSIDTTANNQVDKETVELQNAGNDLMHGTKKRAAK
jgi:hypothetical protein